MHDDGQAELRKKKTLSIKTMGVEATALSCIPPVLVPLHRHKQLLTEKLQAIPNIN